MKWGLIGTRGYAQKSGAPGIRASERAELAAVLGRDPAATKAFAEANDARGFTDIDRFLAAGLDAVWITSPTWLHREQTTAALDAGLHVLCEKPLAPSSEDAWAVVKAAAASGKILATGYQGRYVPGHRAMAHLIADGAIGDVTVARTYYGVHRSGPPPEWRTKRPLARWGALADVGTHHVDLLRMLLGEINEAQGLTGHQLGYETEDVAAGSLRFESGAVATLTVTVNVWRQQTRVEVHGTTGALVATDTNPAGQGQVFWYDGSTAEGKDITGARPPNLWAAQVDAVTAAAEGEDVSYGTGEDGARSVDVLEQLSPRAGDRLQP
jgi:1,5-anhydro-D-fructose reductase (1,5-anhydro-D-mannitol-forming)